MSFAATLSSFVPSSVKLVLEQLMVAVEAFWQDNQLPTKQAVGVTQRVLRLSDRLEVLLERFRAGKVKWRPRAAAVPKVSVVAAEPAVPLDPAEAAAAADAAMTSSAEKAFARPRRAVYGLPPYYGWLSQKMPMVAMTVGSDLDALFRTDDMRALMLATPEVARMAGPVFRMLGLDDSLLLVPVGYTGPGVSKNRRFYAPEPKRRGTVSDYVPGFIVPEDYDEARDGRKPHPLRDPSWNYAAFVDYRSYLYFYMGRAPERLRHA